MKKNELIEKLQSIKGNPDIIIWNGIVKDYQYLKNVDKTKLFKIDDKFELKIMNCERKEKKLPPVEKLCCTNEYTLSNPEIDKTKIKTKTAIILEAKPRNRKSSNRRINIEY